MSHAYIWEAENKNAHEFAKGLNCLKKAATPLYGGLGAAPPLGDGNCASNFLANEEGFGNNGNSCECISCKVFESGNHPDTIYVTGTKSGSIGVDDVREQIILPMSSKPFRYKYKVFIVENAETLTPQAQNALLKTIEEPAPYGVFLFVCKHIHNFLPTLMSRCVRKRKQTSDTKITAISSEIEELANEIYYGIQGKDIFDAFLMYRLFEPYKDSKETIQNILNLLYSLYCERFKYNQHTSLINAIEAIVKTKKILSQNGNTQLALELLLLELSKV